MSDKCGKCVKVFVESDVVVKCSDCKVPFHSACTRAGSTRSATKSGNRAVKCDSCVEESKSNASNRSSEGVDDKKVILEAIQSLRVDISKIDEKMNAVLLTVSGLQEENRKLSEGAIKLEGEQRKLQERCEGLSIEVQDLQLRLHDAEQRSRASNIEIVGIPATHNENITDCLSNVADALGLGFNAEDISAAHRLRNYSKKRHSHPPIIVQFVSRSTRNEWLGAAREKRNLDAVDIHPSLQRSRVYINEQLTPHNKALLGKARRLRREKKIFFAGFFNGNIVIKPSEGAESVRVTKLNDLDVYDRKEVPLPDKI